MLRHKPTHKGFKRKTRDEMYAARKRFQSAKSDHQLEKEKYNAEWKEDHKHLKFCWSCGVRADGNPDNVITQMHGLKQRYIRTREDCRFAAYVCWREHKDHDEAQGVEVHLKMAEFVRGLIVKIKALENALA
jgi:hypothetical protein